MRKKLADEFPLWEHNWREGRARYQLQSNSRIQGGPF